MPKPKDPTQPSRREFFEGTGAVVITSVVTAAAIVPALSAQTPNATPQTSIRVTLNGSQRTVQVQPHWTLAETLRDHFKLTGTKLGCDRGECGACTVLIDGKPGYSCSQLAVWITPAITSA